MDINTRKDGCRFETWSYRRKEWKERPLFVNYFLIVTFIDIQISHFNMYATEKAKLLQTVLYMIQSRCFPLTLPVLV